MRQKISYELSQRILPTFMEELFERRSGPNEEHWKLTVHPKWRKQNTPNERTGKMRRGFRFSGKTTADGIELTVTNSQPYWQYTNEGTSHQEARRTWPIDDAERMVFLPFIVSVYHQKLNEHFERSF